MQFLEKKSWSHRLPKEQVFAVGKKKQVQEGLPLEYDLLP